MNSPNIITSRLPSNTPRAIKICALADEKCYIWKIHNAATGELVAWNFGNIPPDHAFKWDQKLREFFALAEAARHVEASLPDCRVTLTCLGQLRRQSREGRRQRWAA